MNLEGRKLSGSKNWAVWGLDFLERYDPDSMRYYLTVNMPETRDSDWDWEEFYQRNNNELVATWGNLANRVLSFAYKYWEGKVPDPGELREQDHELLETLQRFPQILTRCGQRVCWIIKHYCMGAEVVLNFLGVESAK